MKLGEKRIKLTETESERERERKKKFHSLSDHLSWFGRFCFTNIQGVYGIEGTVRLFKKAKFFVPRKQFTMESNKSGFKHDLSIYINWMRSKGQAILLILLGAYIFGGKFDDINQITKANETKTLYSWNLRETQECESEHIYIYKVKLFAKSKTTTTTTKSGKRKHRAEKNKKSNTDRIKDWKEIKAVRQLSFILHMYTHRYSFVYWKCTVLLTLYTQSTEQVETNEGVYKTWKTMREIKKKK